MNDATSNTAAAALAERLARLDPLDQALIGRLVDLFSATPSEPATLRAARFELVDDRGQVRAVLGDLAGSDLCAWLPGLSLRGPAGDERVSLMVDVQGTALNFAFAGDEALIVGVDDPGSLNPGPFVELLDRDGHIAAAWRVLDDGLAVEPEVE